MASKFLSFSRSKSLHKAVTLSFCTYKYKIKMQDKSMPVIFPHNALSTYSQECLEQSMVYIGFGSISSSENGTFSIDKRNGIWTLIESEKYKNFLKRYWTIFLEHRLRRCNQIFVQMSKTIKSRMPLQCRSHHQKMLKRHRTIDQIITYFEDKLQREKQVLTFEKSRQLSCDKKQKKYTMDVTHNKIRIIIKGQYVGCYQLKEQ